MEPIEISVARPIHPEPWEKRLVTRTQRWGWWGCAVSSRTDTAFASAAAGTMWTLCQTAAFHQLASALHK